MAVTQHPNSRDYWIIVYYPEGRKIDPNTGKANTKRERLIYGPCSYETAKLYEQELVRTSRKAVITLDPRLCDIFAEFLANYRLEVQESTLEDFEQVWANHLLAAFGNLRITQITPQTITTFKQNKLDYGLKPRTINKILSNLSAVLTWCALPERNYGKLNFTIAQFPRKMTRPPPKILPSQDEIDRLIECLPNDNAGALVKVMYFGGLRIGDARAIESNQVNLEESFMIVIGKGNKQRLIPLTKELLDVIKPRLRPQIARSSDLKQSWLLWPNPRTGKPFTTVSGTLKAACLKAGISKNVTHHILRHCFGTHLLMQGANVRSTQILMGHADISTTEKYTHLDSSFLMAEMSKLSRVSAEPKHQETNIIVKKLEVSKELLEKLVKRLPMTLIGEIYGVSDNAIRKRCVTLGIEIKRRKE